MSTLTVRRSVSRLFAAFVLLIVIAGCPGPCGEGDSTTDIIMLPGLVPLEMVWIPAGAFIMGGEEDSTAEQLPQHEVSIEGFWLSKYELTKRQWAALMETTPWNCHANVLDDPDSPAVFVSWYDARHFTRALNLYTGQDFRLPSEAEWEYAVRAGTSTKFYWGNDDSLGAIGDYAWYDGNAWEVNERYAHSVGLKLPNAFGLFDMSGNVFEWCEDDWHDNYAGAPNDGSAWTDTASTDVGVFRGGSWGFPYGCCYSASRPYMQKYARSSSIGFRVARQP